VCGNTSAVHHAQKSQGPGPTKPSKLGRRRWEGMRECVRGRRMRRVCTGEEVAASVYGGGSCEECARGGGECVREHRYTMRKKCP